MRLLHVDLMTLRERTQIKRNSPIVWGHISIQNLRELESEKELEKEAKG